MSLLKCIVKKQQLLLELSEVVLEFWTLLKMRAERRRNAQEESLHNTTWWCKRCEVGAEEETSFRAGQDALDNESTRCSPPFGFGKKSSIFLELRYS